MMLMGSLFGKKSTLGFTTPVMKIVKKKSAITPPKSNTGFHRRRKKTMDFSYHTIRAGQVTF